MAAFTIKMHRDDDDSAINIQSREMFARNLTMKNRVCVYVGKKSEPNVKWSESGDICYKRNLLWIEKSLDYRSIFDSFIYFMDFTFDFDLNLNLIDFFNVFWVKLKIFFVYVMLTNTLSVNLKF